MIYSKRRHDYGDEMSTKQLTLGGQIKNARLERGWTQDELAGRVGRSRISVSDWERGVKVPGVTAIPRLVAELDIPVELLVAASQHTKKNIEVAA